MTLHVKARSSRIGSATVELIIVMPFLLFILLGGLDMGRVVMAKVALTSAVHVGVAQGARVIQLKVPDATWSDAPAWAFDEGTGTIVFDIDTISEIITSMENAAKADIAGIGKEYEKALNFDNNTEVFCRCLTTDSDGTVEYGDPVTCVDDEIVECEKGTGLNAARQIFVSMQPKLSVRTVFNWPFIPRQIVLSASAVMQGDEYVE